MTDKPRRDALLVGAVFALALLARLLYLYQSLDNPSFGTPVVDAGDYDLLARRLLEDGSLDARLFWQPFLYPWFLAGVYGFSAGSILAAKLVQAFLGSVTCVLVFLLGRRLFDRATGWIAAVATALYGPLIFFESELLATGWAAFLAVALLLLVLRAAERPRPLETFGLGSVAALAILTRPSFLPFAVAAWLWLVARSFGARHRPAPIPALLAAPLAGFALLVAPVAMITHAETGRASFLPASGGLNAYIGNNPDTCATLAIRPGQDWMDLVSMPELHGAVGLAEANRYFVSRVREFALDRPLDYARGLGAKTLRFLSSRELPRNVDVYFATQWSSWLGALVWKLGPFGFPFGVLLPLAVLGLWRRRAPAPVWLFLVLYPASIVLVFVSGRYRIPIVPILAVAAAAGALALFQDLAHRRWRSVASAGIVLVAALLTTTLPGPFCEEGLELESDFYYTLAHSQTERQDLVGAISSYQRSLAADPNQPDVHYNLGLLLSGRGELEEAARYYAEALRIDPRYAKAANNLGSVLLRQGRPQEALARFAEAARLDADLAPAQRNLARSLLAAGRAPEAVEPLRRAMDLEPRPAEDHFLLGSVALQTGDTDGAIRELTTSLRLRPAARTHNDLGVTYLGSGKHQEALEQFQAAIRIEPAFSDAYGNAGVALTLLGRLEEARGAFEQALRRRPRDLDSRLNLAVVLSRLGDREQAAARLEEILALEPQHPRAAALLDRLTAGR